MKIPKFIAPKGTGSREYGTIGIRLGASVGLCLGICYAFGGFFVELMTNNINQGTWMAFGALIGMPLIFGILGWVLGCSLKIFQKLLSGL